MSDGEGPSPDGRPGRFRAAVAVYAVLVREGRVLLMRRAGSGYHDGELALPAGHLDGGEDAVSGLARELREELGIDVDPSACRLVKLVHRAREHAEDDEYLDLILTVDAWRGEPRIVEPHKCTELVWAEPSGLPADMIPYNRALLERLDRADTLLLEGWPVRDAR